MAMPEGLGRHAAPATKGLVEVRQIIEASLRGDLGERHRRTAHETLGPPEFDLPEVGFQRHANYLVERVRELGAAQRGHGRKIGKRNALPDVPIEERADPPHGASVPGHGERMAQEGSSRSPTLADRLAGERGWEPPEIRRLQPELTTSAETGSNYFRSEGVIPLGCLPIHTTQGVLVASLRRTLVG
jgi:hypothetical protein